MMTDTPRIYVACLAAYNNGKLHGEWIDADQDADDIHAEIKAMLETSPEPGAEEWAIHDSEGIECDSFTSVGDVVRLVALIGEHGEAANAALDYNGGNVAHAEQLLANGYGLYDDLEDYARQYVEETQGEVPLYLEGAVDWDKVGEHLTTDRVVLELESGGIAVCSWG